MWKRSLCDTRHPPLKSFSVTAAWSPLRSSPCVSLLDLCSLESRMPFGESRVPHTSQLVSLEAKEPVRQTYEDVITLAAKGLGTAPQVHTFIVCWGSWQEAVCKCRGQLVLAQWRVARFALKRIDPEKVKPAWLDWINNLCTNAWQQIWFKIAWKGKYGLKPQK